MKTAPSFVTNDRPGNFPARAEADNIIHAGELYVNRQWFLIPEESLKSGN
jgi:hypothetical protein